jgi:hypothetical protein
MSHLISRARFILALTILVLASATHADASPSIQVASTLCPGGTGVATLSPPDGGGSWASVQWSITNGTIISGQGSTTLTFWNQSLATITIGASATDTNGGTFTAAPATVFVHQTTAPDVDTKGSVCIGGNGTAVVRNASSYPSPITWQVTNGLITQNHGDSIDYTAGTSGDVLILASSYDANGCYVATQWQVHIVPQPSAEISVNASACSGAFDAAVPDGGVGALYEWSIENGAIIAGAGTRQITFVPADGNDVTLDVTVTEYFRGCSNQGSYTGQFVPGDGPQIVLDRTSACPGSTVQASISGTYASINWSVTNGWITQDNGNSITFQFSGGSGPANVAVSVSNGQGCSAYDAADVAVSSIDPPTITVDKPSVCPSFGVVTATIDGNWSNIYWSPWNGEILSQNGNSVTVRSTSQTSGIELTAYVTDAEGCNAMTNSVQIPLRTVTPPTITVDKPSVCPSFGVVTATIDGDWTNIYWSPWNGEILSQNGNSVTVRSTSQTSGIELTAYVTDAEGCNAMTNSVQIPLRTLTPPTITVDKPSVCPSFGVVTATIDGNWTSIYWSPWNGEILSQNGNSVTVRSTSQTSGIELTAYVTDAEGCNAMTNSVQIPLRALTPPTITVDKPSVCPSFGEVTATIDGTWTNIYWSPWNGEIVSQNGNTVTVRSTSPTSGIELTAYVTDAEGCNAMTNSVQIPLRTLTPPAITVDQPSVCPGSGMVTATIDGDWANINWSALNGELSNQNGNTVTVRSTSWASAIELTAYVTDSEGCSTSSTSVQIPLRPAPTVTAGGPTTFCQGGSVILTAPAGMTAYAWSNGANTESITVTESGSYSVTTTEADGCALTSLPTVVTVNPLPASTITASGPTTFCEGGSVTLTASQTAGASYLWSNGATTPDIAVSSSGTFSVVVTSAAGCVSTSAPVAVFVGSYPTAGIHSAQIYDDGGSGTVVRTGDTIDACGNPTIRLVPLALDAAYTYSWSTGATTAVLDVTTSGTYSVTVTAPGGCATTSSVTVNYGAFPPKPTIAATGTELCPAGGSVTLTAPNADAWTWSNGATTQSIVVTETGFYRVRVRVGACDSELSNPIFISTGQSTISTNDSLALCGPGSSATLTANDGTSWLWSNGATTQSIVVSAAGIYRVTTTNNGCTMPESYGVAVTERSVSIDASGPTSFCVGGSVTLTASAGTSWLWSNGATTQSITVSTSGSYGVTATFADGCAISAAPVAVEARQVTVSVTADRTTVCTNGAIVLTASAAGSAGYTYQWYDNTYTPIAGATSSTLTITPTASGFVYVKVLDELGCQVTSGGTSYTVLPTPDATITTAAALCEGQTSGASVVDAGAGATYSWTITNGTLYFPSSSAVTFTPSGLDPVTLTVTVTNAGCSVTSSKSVTINTLPAATITPSGPTTFCAGGSVTLTASAGSSYLWSNGATTQSINVTSSGSFSVTVTNAAGCSATSDVTTVTVNALPTATITPSGPTTFCAGGSVTLTASAGASYLWSNGATTQAINVTASGNYSVTVTNAAGCSATSAATTVTVNAAPTATITPSGATTFCAGGSVTLTASAGSSYLWSTGATTQSINVTTSGNYTVTVTNAAGCSATSAPRNVTVNANPSTPTITAGGPTTFCAGGSVTLSAPAGFAYLWSTGATTQSINVTTGGNYTVTVTNASGCSAISAPTSVTVNAATTISQHPQSITIPKNTGTTLTVTASGTGTLTYQWYRGTSPSTSTPISGAISSSYTTPRLSKGTYTYWVRVSGTCGVANSNTASVTAN